MNIEPKKRKNVFKNLYGKKKIFSTTYIVSQLPNNSGILIRMLSDSIDGIEKITLMIADMIKTKKADMIKVKNQQNSNLKIQ
jgi:hypothetical protein